MIIETTIVCGTVLCVVGGLLWFANKFLTTAKIREETLRTEIHQKAEDYIKNFEMLFRKDMTTLTLKVQSHEDAIKKIANEVVAVGTRAPTGLIGKMMEAQKNKL